MTMEAPAPAGGFNFDLAKRNSYLEVRMAHGTLPVAVVHTQRYVVGTICQYEMLAAGKGRPGTRLHKDGNDDCRRHLQGGCLTRCMCS